MTAITIATDQYYVSETVSDATINATAGDHIVLIYGINDTFTASGGNETILAGQGGNTITVGAGTNRISLGGTNNVLNLSAGTNTVSDQRGHNTLVLTAAGKGTDTIFGPDLHNGDTFDLRPLLASTSWKGDLTSIGDYLHISPSSAPNFSLDVSPTGTGAGTQVAHFVGENAPTLGAFLSHSIF
jgi:Ca2+-binding RTX toxin-like protein